MRLEPGTVENWMIPLAPVGEQSRIVKVLRESVDQISQTVSLTKGVHLNVKTMSSSILNAAFSGRLVPQDPSEGTGHELLEQILKTKAKAESTNAAKAPAKKSRSPK